MPIEHRTRALVLRTFDQGESDRVVHLYTEALGRVAAIAKGARRSKRRFPGTLEILSLVDLRLVDPPRAQLARLEGAKLVRAFEGIPANLGRYAIACQFLELLNRATPDRQPQPELFQFACGVLDVLDGEIPDPLLALLVLAKTLARIGYRPQLVRCALCGADLPSDGGWVGFIPAHGGAVCRSCAGPEEARIPALLLRALEAGLRQPLRSRGELGFSEREVDLAGRLVERFFRFHIGFELRSEAFVRQVFADSQPGADSVDAASGRGDTAPPSDPHPAPARLEPPPL
ncbi:MAG TPA: DNA repair protein RecO [Myxococcota bacterium]|nr:DNA repair protein RecO [Myxococcota bacterium]